MWITVVMSITFFTRWIVTRFDDLKTAQNDLEKQIHTCFLNLKMGFGVLTFFLVVVGISFFLFYETMLNASSLSIKKPNIEMANQFDFVYENIKWLKLTLSFSFICLVMGFLILFDATSIFLNQKTTIESKYLKLFKGFRTGFLVVTIFSLVFGINIYYFISDFPAESDTYVLKFISVLCYLGVTVGFYILLKSTLYYLRNNEMSSRQTLSFFGKNKIKSSWDDSVLYVIHQYKLSFALITILLLLLGAQSFYISSIINTFDFSNFTKSITDLTSSLNFIKYLVEVCYILLIVSFFNLYTVSKSVISGTYCIPIS